MCLYEIASKSSRFIFELAKILMDLNYKQIKKWVLLLL